MKLFYKPKHSVKKSNPYKAKLHKFWLSLICEVELFVEALIPKLRHLWAVFLFHWRKVRYIPRRFDNFLAYIIDRHDEFWDKFDDRVEEEFNYVLNQLLLDNRDKISEFLIEEE